MRISWSIGATTYCYLKCIVYDKLLKPRQSFLITLYINPRWNIYLLHSKVAIFTCPYFLTYFSVKNIRAIYYVTFRSLHELYVCVTKYTELRIAEYFCGMNWCLRTVLRNVSFGKRGRMIDGRSCIWRLIGEAVRTHTRKWWCLK